jgi:hypothetical protein
VSLLKDVAANLLELPDETAQLVGRALSAAGEELAEFAARLDALESRLRASE